jgi:hypothetical protein
MPDFTAWEWVRVLGVAAYSVFVVAVIAFVLGGACKKNKKEEKEDGKTQRKYE